MSSASTIRIALRHISTLTPTTAMSRLIDTTDHAGSKRKNPASELHPHQRAAIFSPHLGVNPASPAAAASAAHGGGTWVGGRSTQTAPSPTLFVTNLDSWVPLEWVAALFSGEHGFVAFRNVRRMCFVDFNSVQAATAAMRKRQNHVFSQPGADPAIAAAAAAASSSSSAAPPVRKMLIDYDKDSRAEKRDKQFTAQVARELNATDSCEQIDLACAACGSFVIKLRIDAPKNWLLLPRRAEDGACVIDTARFVHDLQLVAGEPRAIRRERGVELQHRVVCKACKLTVGYSFTPFNADSKVKHIFIIRGACKGEWKTIREGKLFGFNTNMQMDPPSLLKADKVATSLAAAPVSNAAVESSEPVASSSTSAAAAVDPPDASMANASALPQSSATDASTALVSAEPSVTSMPVVASTDTRDTARSPAPALH